MAVFDELVCEFVTAFDAWALLVEPEAAEAAWLAGSIVVQMISRSILLFLLADLQLIEMVARVPGDWCSFLASDDGVDGLIYSSVSQFI